MQNWMNNRSHLVELLHLRNEILQLPGQRHRLPLVALRPRALVQDLDGDAVRQRLLVGHRVQVLLEGSVQVVADL